MRNRTLMAGGVLLVALTVPCEAEATVVCGVDIVPTVALPISASFHLGSLLPVNIGLGTSGGRQRGWRNATYIASSLNIASSVALLVADSAELGGCGADGLKGIHAASWATESVFTAWSGALLIATALYDTTDKGPPVSGYVVPVREGAVAGVGFAF